MKRIEEKIGKIGNKLKNQGNYGELEENKGEQEM